MGGHPAREGNGRRKAGVADRISMDFMGHTSLGMLTRYSHVFEPEYEVESRKLHLDVDLPLLGS